MVSMAVITSNNNCFFNIDDARDLFLLNLSTLINWRIWKKNTLLLHAYIALWFKDLCENIDDYYLKFAFKIWQLQHAHNSAEIIETGKFHYVNFTRADFVHELILASVK